MTETRRQKIAKEIFNYALIPLYVGLGFVVPSLKYSFDILPQNNLINMLNNEIRTTTVHIEQNPTSRARYESQIAKYESQIQTITSDSVYTSINNKKSICSAVSATGFLFGIAMMAGGVTGYYWKRKED